MQLLLGSKTMSGKIKIKTCLAICLFLLTLQAAATTEAKIIYVDAYAPGNNDGSSWTDAYNFLQDALADANSSAKPVEIRVAQGVYKPDQGTGITPGDSVAAFRLINGVTIKGGYAGFHESDPNARDISLYETILSGDLLRNDNENVHYNEPTRQDNCYHIFYHEDLNLDDTAILDGFTITGGNANGGWPSGCGGGMFNYYSSPAVKGCTFTANSSEYGGGMHNYYSSPTVGGCTFSGNSADRDGGGMDNAASSPIVENCTFTKNLSDWGNGGGMSNYYSSPKVTNCTFSENSAINGGGMCNEQSSPNVINCTFSGNGAWLGGGMCNCLEDSSPTVTNCTFSANSAEWWSGGGMYNQFGSSPTVTNCILWADIPEAEEIEWGIVTYSDVQGGWGGQDNINVDPCFAQPGYWDPNGTPDDPNDDFWIDGDYHLKSQAGRWDADEGRWKKDEVTSLCIDAGDPASPIGLEPFPNGGIINMGAYGGTAEASKSYFGEPVCETIVAGDINGDCIVNLKDFALLAFHWLEEH
jgi:hypothetical protein